MGANFSPELKHLLAEGGCRFERPGLGDHDIWFSPHTGIRFMVDHEIRSRHTANGVLRQAAAGEAFLKRTGLAQAVRAMLNRVARRRHR